VPIETFNSALIMEDLLWPIVAVIEGRQAPGPAFVYAFGSLSEAAILHEHLYVDPADMFKGSGPEHLHGMLAGSPLIRRLFDTKTLERMPAQDDIERHLAMKGASYEFGHFLTDMNWLPYSLSGREVESVARTIAMADLCRQWPAVFGREMVDDPSDMSGLMGPHEGLDLTDPVVIASAERLGFLRDDLDIIDGQRHKVWAYSDLASELSLNLYPVLAALPYMFANVGHINTKARLYYEKIRDSITEYDNELKYTSFTHIPMSPLGQIVLDKAQGDRRGIVDALVDLRQKQTPFRQTLTQIDRDSSLDATRKEQHELERELNGALQTLVVGSKEPKTRLVYRVWDILKTGPVSAGDAAKRKGQELHVVGRIRGLHDFWNALMDSPVARKNRNLLGTTFGTIASEQVWAAGQRLGDSLEAVRPRGAE